MLSEGEQQNTCYEGGKWGDAGGDRDGRIDGGGHQLAIEDGGRMEERRDK